MKKVETRPFFGPTDVKECLVCDMTSDKEPLTGVRVNGGEPIFFCRRCAKELYILTVTDNLMQNPTALA